MIDKIYLSPNDELTPCVVYFDNEVADYLVDIPNGITRSELIDLVDEIKRITEFEAI